MFDFTNKKAALDRFKPTNTVTFNKANQTPTGEATDVSFREAISNVERNRVSSPITDEKQRPVRTVKDVLDVLKKYMSSGGGSGGGGAIINSEPVARQKVSVVAIEGQTLINIAPFEYEVGADLIDVTVNGLVQQKDAYTETLPSELVFTDPLTAGDVVEITIYQAGAFTVLPTAENISATDGFGGLLWNTVQKFINYIKGPNGSSQVGYTPAGTGAVATVTGKKLQREVRSVFDFMTEEQISDARTMTPVLDHTAALNAAFVACSVVNIPANCVIRITSLVIIPTGKDLVGESRYTSQILVDADTDGIRAGIQTTVRDLRIKGGASVTAARALFLLRDDNCFRSNFTRLIIGGFGTSLGDTTNTRCPAMGIKSGNTFLIGFSDSYIFNCGIGWDNYSSTNGRLNACEISNVEMHSCGLGARLKVLNGVTFNNWVSENCDQEGLIVSSCRGVTFNSPYFEVNNQQNTGLYKAEFIIKADGLNGGSNDVGGSVQINDPYMSPGANSVVGLQIEQQRLAFLNGGHFINFAGKPNTIIIDAPGQATNFFINSGVAPVFNANLVVGPYTQTGASPLGFVGPRFRTKNGQTPSLGIGVSSILFTPVVGESGILTIQATNNNSSFRWSGVIQRFSTSITVVTLDSSNLSVTDSAGAVNLTQTGGGAIAFVWSYIRTQ